MKTHELKTWPEFFSSILHGTKTFEVRKNDRGFQVGDILHLKEWSILGGYTGREIRKQISFAMIGPSFVIPEDYAVLALAEIIPDNRSVCHACDGTGFVPS